MAAYHHVADEQRSGPLDPQHNANAMGGKQSALSIEYVDGGVSLACAIQTDQHKGSLPLEIPDSDEHPDIDDGQSSKSFETIDTELVARGTEITHKAKTTLTLHSRGIDCNGRLASEAPQFANQGSMDGPATQPATQPFADPRRQGNPLIFSEEDESDVLCVLHPASPSAQACLKLVADSAPQHILQNKGLSYKLENIEEPKDEKMTDGMDTEIGSPGMDIALRMSSRLKNPASGFVFGRTPMRSDILLVEESKTLISNSHFRIYVNKAGVLMVEDMSTNGLFVDELPLRLKPKPPDPEVKVRQMVASGSVIILSLSEKKVSQLKPEEMVRFIVRIPSRHRVRDRFQQKLADYLAYIEQVERQAIVRVQGAVKGAGNPSDQIPLNPLGNIFQEAAPPRVSSTRPLAARSHYGTEWNGGAKYNIVGKIGQGAFAIVYQLATKSEGELFAAKEIEKRRFMKNGSVDAKIMNEIRIMKNLKHPNIVDFVAYEETSHHLYIIMEYVEYGDLMVYIDSGIVMPEYICQSVAHQLCLAIEYLHGSNVTHRDIKPDNILVKARDPLIVKLSDFGLSKRIENAEEDLKTFCGTLLYCAPEIYPDYADYKNGMLGKRHRKNDPPPQTKPYKPSVDIWALAAVLYHLLCNKPPWQGSALHQGQNMLRNIMENKVDYKRLRSAGVSELGIDFISRMLQLDPTQRPTEIGCLQHAWIVNRADGKAADIEMKDLDGPLDDIEDDCEFDASQLSLVDTGLLGTQISDDEYDIDEVEDEHPSKRLKLDHQPNLESPVGSSSDDDTSLHAGVTLTASKPPQGSNSNTNRLFGEIGASALRSSGVLDFDAHTALDIPFDRRVTAASGALTRQSVQSPQPLPDPLFAGSAPSLLGAEALVGQLHMASLQQDTSGSSDGMPPTKPPKDKADISKIAVTGSKNISHTLAATEQSAPKRAKVHRLEDGSQRFHQAIPMTHASGSGNVEGYHDKQHKSPNEAMSNPSKLPSVRKTKDADDFNESTPPDAPMSSPQTTQSPSHSYLTDADGHAVTESKTHASSENASTSANAGEITSDEAVFTRPPPRLGVLTSVPGSICNTTIKLEERLTYYGRDPSSHVQHADTKDTRIPRHALDIIFWRPGIETAIANGQNWAEVEDIYAILHTRTRLFVRVNGVKLSRGEGCWCFGRLHTGDIITVFGPAEGEEAEGKAAEFLKFRCEFFIGASAKPRDDKTTFVIEREEEKYNLNQARCASQLSSNAASQTSQVSANSPSNALTTTKEDGPA